MRASVFSAYVVSWVAVALLWLWLLDADAGLVSGVLGRCACGVERAGWLADPERALVRDRGS